MKIERRKPTRAEWAMITSSRPVVRKVRRQSTRPTSSPHTPAPTLGRGLSKKFGRRIKQLFAAERRQVIIAKGEIVTEYMTAPTTNGDKPLPRRAGVRSMVPSTWIGRSLRIEYEGAGGASRETTATFLDWCPAGLLLGIAGGKTLLAWERLVLAELQEDR